MRDIACANGLTARELGIARHSPREGNTEDFFLYTGTVITLERKNRPGKTF